MNQIQNQGQVVLNALNDFWTKLVDFLPGLIGAIVIVVVGLIIAAIVARIVERVVKMLKIDHVITTVQHEIQGRPGHEIRASVVLREVVRWFLIFIFLTAASETLGLKQLSNFLNSISLYIPNIIVAVIILTITLMLAKYVREIVMDSEAVANKFESRMIASLAKWAIIVFGVLAALIQLGVAPSLINELAAGIIFAFSLATGLAFGLGGREEAQRILQNFRQRMQK